MKKLKIIILLIITSILIIFLKNYAIALPYDGELSLWNIPTHTGTYGKPYYHISNSHMSGFNNVYCVKPGYAVRDNEWWLTMSEALIDGDTVTFYTYSSKGEKTGKSFQGTTGIHNNILAAILCAEEWDYGPYSSTSGNPLPKTGSQKSLYAYWNTWVYASGANKYGMVGCETGGYSLDSKYKNYANQRNYKVRIYFLKAYKSGYQNLILVNRYGSSTREPPTINISVTKSWNDNGGYGNRPSSITVKLYKNGSDTGKSLILNSGNGWKGKFSNVDTGTGYSVKESTVPAGYTVSYSGNQTNGFTITNTLQYTSVKVTKTWSDENNRDGKRPSSVKVTLYENGTATSTTATLSSSNSWTYTFSNLPKYKNKKAVTYTVQETAPNGYTPSVSGSASSGFTITNTHIPEKINVNVKKVWKDDHDSSDDNVDNGIYNFDELRPNSITVTLKANGQKVTKNASGQTITNPITLSGTSNEWTGTFTDLYKYENGKEIVYTIEEAGCPVEYTSSKSGNATNGYTVTNTHIPSYDGYKEIKGQVWVDGDPGKGKDMNGTFGEEDTPLEGITVRLKYIDSNGKSQDFDPANPTRYETKTDVNGNYSIKINYDISQNVYKLYEDPTTTTYKNSLIAKLATAYVEFEYDGMLYTTINYNGTESKAKEDETRRSTVDANYDTVNSNTPVFESTNSYWNWDKRKITANTRNIVSLTNTEFEKAENQKKTTEILKYCSGNRQTQRTNPTGAWKTIKTGTCNNCTGKEENLLTFDIYKQVIENVNCALFVREQPDVAIFSDISKVEVEMNNQRYTYLYNVRSSELQAAGGLKTKFQNKDTYTYRRPVNPADIAYINKNDAQMDVYVTYEIKVANLSATLKTTIDEIVNVYDSQYEINTIKKGNTTLSPEDVTIYEKSEKYNQIKLKNLGITLDRETSANEENTIIIRYKVKLEKVKGLLNDESPLNNAVEILKYKTTYGEETVYAEQRTGGRTGQSYAGYDFDSHPGDAGIFINGNGRLEAAKLQDDTDIAPAFVLCKDEPTSVSGIVWEDSDENKNDNERLGNGKIDNNETNRVKNVKIELLEVDNNGTITAPATLYTIDSTGNIKNEDNTVYSEDDGKYTFKGLVTGKEYFIKYTYGNDTNEPGVNTTTISGNIVNARNYKSTIITEEYMKEIIGADTLTESQKKEWPLVHAAGCSVAVDNMKKRTEISSLRNGNYDQGVNMYAYTKQFIIPLEITLETSGNSDANGNVTDSKGNEIGNTLDKLDFGIIERPREALIVQKTITNFKITLANGQVLVEGDPTTQSLNYVKAIGFKESANMDEVINSVEKRLSVEIDSELIQGAQLEATYKVKVKNNNEIDYDYGEDGNYGDEYITTSPLANYYYYGNSMGTNGEMKSTITFVDYLDKDIGQSYTDVNNYWSEITDLDTLWKNGTEERYISDEVKNELAKGGYKIFQKESIELGIGDITEQEMKISKLLTSKNDHPYANHAEIIEIDGKTARTIKGLDKNNNQLVYTPGNYVPAKGVNEADDDKVDILVTPPTGITTYIMTYVISGLVGLIIIVAGIVFIKKKILTK